MEEIKISNILGKKVTWVTWQPIDGLAIFNAYVVIPNSRFLKIKILGTDVTYRDGDEIGVDSAHKWLEDKPVEDRIKYCADAIKRIIENCKAVELKKPVTDEEANDYCCRMFGKTLDWKLKDVEQRLAC